MFVRAGDAAARGFPWILDLARVVPALERRHGHSRCERFSARFRRSHCVDWQNGGKHDTPLSIDDVSKDVQGLSLPRSAATSASA
jgi:hypothetical protein